MMTADLRGEESASCPALLCPTPGQPLSFGSRTLSCMLPWRKVSENEKTRFSFIMGTGLVLLGLQ